MTPSAERRWNRAASPPEAAGSAGCRRRGASLVDAVTVSRWSLRSKGIPAYVCKSCRKLPADY